MLRVPAHGDALRGIGERGALTSYGKPQRPEFDWRRT